MPKPSTKLTTDQLGQLIYEIRCERVMLDSDLASIYGVETKALNRAVKRNRDRFPKDFVFQLSENEWKNLRYRIGTSSSNRKYQSLRYQIGTSSLGHGGRRSCPYVFTEHGAIMAASVLNSRRAVQMNTTCGDAVGWTALSVWETGERSGERESTCLSSAPF
jgi:ORF6N domain